MSEKQKEKPDGTAHQELHFEILIRHKAIFQPEMTLGNWIIGLQIGGKLWARGKTVYFVWMVQIAVLGYHSWRVGNRRAVSHGLCNYVFHEILQDYSSKEKRSMSLGFGGCKSKIG